MDSTVAPTASENLPAMQSVHLEEPEIGLYLPATQLVQKAKASVAEYFPAWQSTQVDSTVAPTAPEYLPGPQTMHMLEEFAPVVVEYLPASQLMQTEEPSLSEYMPIRQDVQVAAVKRVDPTGPYLPAAHKVPEQVEGVVAPTTTENLPASQSMQTEEPAFAWYFPASQLVQADAAAADWYLPASQLKQVTELVCPVAPENLPAAQSTQVSEVEAACTEEYLPAKHPMQDIAPAPEWLPAVQLSQTTAATLQHTPTSSQ